MLIGVYKATTKSCIYLQGGGAPKVREELHGQRKWMKEWRQVGRHLQAMEGEREVIGFPNLC